jgi:hypothetical protein
MHAWFAVPKTLFVQMLLSQAALLSDQICLKVALSVLPLSWFPVPIESEIFDNAILSLS